MNTCTHVPPSPGQSMCQCAHMRVEMEFAAAIVDRARDEAPHCATCVCSLEETT